MDNKLPNSNRSSRQQNRMEKKQLTVRSIGESNFHKHSEPQ